MRLFNFGSKASAPDQAAIERQRASQANLVAGGLPLNAVDRLNEQRSRQGTSRHFFTSDLSAGEIAATHQLHYSPLGQVMGSSVYQVGWQVRNQGWGNSAMYGGGASYELDVMTQAQYNARHLALNRLLQEAVLLGATGVIGVRIERKGYDWGIGLLEFAAIGTAIRESNLPPPQPGAPQYPVFISDLSGEDFWKLCRGGFRPAGVALGNCSYYQIPTFSTQRATQGGIFSGSWMNQELPDYTQALYNCRELAMSRMEQEARAVGATGIVGVTTDIEAQAIEVDLGNDRHRTDMMYHFNAIGTAIKPAPTPVKPLRIAVTVPLCDAAGGTDTF
jgi:uncharacterized protein YbjQ (UPF0145 family)